jgi:2-polyprenyl-6-methoxyphenol hydroxylase-like FAD-dependent oxidoreductase
VAIIGAGPVGLVASLFLQKYGFDYSLIEKRVEK